MLPPGLPRVAVEAGVTDFWRKYVGAVDSNRGAVIGERSSFSLSATAKAAAVPATSASTTVVTASRDKARRL